MSLRAAARAYAYSSNPRAWTELLLSFTAYGVLFYAAYLSFDMLWISIPLMGLLSLPMLRLYIIQHDCAHHAFFESTRLNEWVGVRLCGFSMTPFQATQFIHNQHHQHVSDLDHRETFEIFVMTIDEWNTAGFWKRLGYRLYRSPITLIFVGPFLFFAIIRRFPKEALTTGILNVLVHNLLAAAVVGTAYLLAGWSGVWVWLGCFYFASVLGAFVSYVVHNFEEIHWGVKPELDFQTAALEGSSVLDWGWFFDLALMNIGYHDLHHLNSKIPGYRLKQAHQALETQGLIEPVKIGLWDSILCLRWKLYDESAGVMIPFPNRRLPSSAIPAE